MKLPTFQRPALIWIGLAATSALVAGLLSAAAVPAAILIGPMITAIAVGLTGANLRVPRPLFLAAQGVVGCVVAASITPETLAEMARDWPLMAFGAFVTVASSAGVGILLARFGSLPGSTAAWGTSPGAASAMVIMARDYGADPRLVATMQYVRVIAVVLAASVISRELMDPGAPALPPTAANPFDPVAAGLCAVLAIGGSWLAARLRIPAGGLLVPLALASALNATGLVRVTVPPPMLVVGYAVIGWAIGLQFERGSLIRSIRALPEMLASALVIVAICGGGAWVMMRISGVSALTAFLATTPGGIDTVAIIALSGGADTSFVMALHAVRLLAVILLGPAIARGVARLSRPD